MAELTAPAEATFGSPISSRASARNKEHGSIWRDVVPFLALFGVAVAIRLAGLDWGGHHPDENPSGAAKVLTGQLSVSSFYPPLLDYLVAVSYAALYVIGRALSWWSSTGEFRATFFEDRDTFYLTARLVTTALSALIAPMTFLLAVTHGISRRSAILAGGVAAFIPGTVFWAHIAKSDVALAPAFLFVVIAASSVVRHPSDRRRAALLGLALALALSVKHSAVFFVAPFLLITLYSSRQWAAHRLTFGTILAVAISTVLFWIPLNIGIVTDPQPFLDAQLVQTSMSVRSSGVSASIEATLAALTSADAGLPAGLLRLWAGAVATFGKISVEPNGVNAIPSLVRGWLDARAADQGALDTVIAGIETAARETAARHGIDLSVVRESFTPVVEFEHALRDELVRLLGEKTPVLGTGAGHDAGILSASVPTAMLFVRNPTGVSHSPAEFSAEDDCVAGVVALADVLEGLACR